jgi:hypothetical protein
VTLRPCLDCGQPCPGPRCDAHAVDSKPSARARGTTQAGTSSADEHASVSRSVWTAEPARICRPTIPRKPGTVVPSVYQFACRTSKFAADPATATEAQPAVTR